VVGRCGLNGLAAANFVRGLSIALGCSSLDGNNIRPLHELEVRILYIYIALLSLTLLRHRKRRKLL
jgi:hypothetical protein